MAAAKKRMFLASLASATLFATSCVSDLRDAALAGLLDYVTATTTDLVSVFSPLDDLAGGE